MIGVDPVIRRANRDGRLTCQPFSRLRRNWMTDTPCAASDLAVLSAFQFATPSGTAAAPSHRIQRAQRP